MHWGFLTAAIVFEVAGTTCMKLSDGFTRLTPSVLLFVLYGLSFAGLTFALKKIEIGTAYAIWAGVGTALIAVIGFIWFKEPMGALKIGSIALIIVGVIGLNLAQGGH